MNVLERFEIILQTFVPSIQLLINFNLGHQASCCSLGVYISIIYIKLLNGNDAPLKLAFSFG